jgi:putative hydrolase of the HAD superfamily
MQASWLFFDMGSTIMNETPAMEKRIRDTLAGTGITYEAFAAKMADFPLAQDLVLLGVL